jgi:hypothetical protein
MAMIAPATTMEIKELRELPTEDRLLRLYELGIEAAAARDTTEVSAVLTELIGALDFGYADIADAFIRLYAYCLERCEAGDLDHVAFVLADLRATLSAAATDAAAR